MMEIAFSCNNPLPYLKRAGNLGKTLLERVYLGTLENQDAWTNGFIVDIGSPPKAASAPLPKIVELDHLSNVKRGIPAHVAIYAEPDYNDPLVVILADDQSGWEVVNPKLAGYFVRKYKEVSFLLSPKYGGALSVLHKGARVGIVMPLNIDYLHRVKDELWKEYDLPPAPRSAVSIAA